MLQQAPMKLRKIVPCVSKMKHLKTMLAHAHWCKITSVDLGREWTTLIAKHAKEGYNCGNIALVVR